MEDENGGAVRSNGYDPEAVKSFVARIENLQGEIEELREAFKSDCEPLKEDIKVVKEEAEYAGIPKKELNKVLSARALAQKIEKQRGKLEPHEKTNYDNLMLALGGLKDLPLGIAALGKAATAAQASA